MQNIMLTYGKIVKESLAKGDHNIPKAFIVNEIHERTHIKIATICKRLNEELPDGFSLTTGNPFIKI